MSEYTYEHCKVPWPRSLYHHFDSKDAMALAVLERSTEWVRARCIASPKCISTYLRTLSGRGRERGQFQIRDQRSRDVAMQIVAGIQGALLMGRLTGDPHAINTVVAEFQNYLGYVLPGKKA